ncbi:hypothetical protein [Microvirga arvi]|uniref:hypothetical protein n=1 Tax=Microvirga arvi TaxID=2778731 RepID=UPI00194EBFEA|nr:hypothetical protein [Microvirga arvi]
MGDLEGRSQPAPLLYVVVSYGDGEVERARVFTSMAAALACRDKHVAENWETCLPNEPMPDDPEEAADQFNMEAYGQGELVRLLTADIED